MDRDAIAADLERARVRFHQLLAAAGPADWRKPTGETRWTNEQLLFHMNLHIARDPAAHTSLGPDNPAGTPDCTPFPPKLILTASPKREHQYTPKSDPR
jgi:hypothetical protein